MTTATPTEKPILFSTELVQAILDGRKSQTRRVIKDLDNCVNCFHPLKNGEWEAGQDYFNGDGEAIDVIKCPYGQSGGELWVRETWRPIGWRCDEAYWKIQYKTGDEVVFRDQLYPPENPLDADLLMRLADELMDKDAPELDREEGGWSTETIKEYLAWKPSIHMPRGASRIQLTVEDIRVERVQDITYQDILAEAVHEEGFTSNTYNDPENLEAGMRNRFRRLWDSINADRGYPWESNPFVWVVKFSIKNIKG